MRVTLHLLSCEDDFRVRQSKPIYMKNALAGAPRSALLYAVMGGIMNKSIKDTVKEAILPTVTELGYRIWDITFSKIGADYHLEITIDSDKGIEIDDCEKVHRAIDPIIDECNPYDDFYYLEVSSPGVERELRTDEHILSSLGERVEAKLFTAKDGTKAVCGRLASFEDGELTIDTDGGSISLKRSDISKLKTLFFED